MVTVRTLTRRRVLFGTAGLAALAASPPLLRDRVAFAIGETFPIGTTVHVDTASGGSANLRSAPGITASVVRIVANGTTGTVQSGETAADGYRWVKVAIAGTTGYMATTVLAAGTGSVG